MKCKLVASAGQIYSKAIFDVMVTNMARKILLYAQDVILRVVHVLVKT